MIKQGFGWRGWFAVVASLCFAMPAAAHLMPAQQGTLNMVRDGVFVAVALPHPGNPPIYNAVDSDWKIYQVPLERNGLKIEQLCPDCLKAA